MKKFLCLLLAIVLCISMVACNSKPTDSSSKKEENTKKQTNTTTPEAEKPKVEPKITSYVCTVGLKDDGTLLSTDKYNTDIESWTDIKNVECASSDYFGLKTDGTIVASKEVKPEFTDETSKWSDIVDIATLSTGHLVGLKSDGKVEFISSIPNADSYNDWNDLVDIDSGYFHILGLKKDGTCVASPSGGFEMGQGNVSSWTDITAVAAGCSHSVGLKSDGTVVATGDNKSGECNVSGWTDIVAIDAGLAVTVGITSSGTVVACGDLDGRYDLDALASWRNIAKISVDTSNIFGIKNDGTLVVSGDADPEDFKNWDLIS